MSSEMLKKPQPKWLLPMLATLSENKNFAENWIYERKLDGIRCLLYKKGKEVIIWSRNKIEQNDAFPELVAALKTYKSDFIFDSEVVAFAGKKTSFPKLIDRFREIPSPKLIKKIPITTYIFDILYLNGYDLTQLPLLMRKKILKENFQFVKPLKYLTHRSKNGAKYYEYACNAGWEGLIAKQADSIYLHKRTKTWLKYKCSQTQELLIGGFTDPQGSRNKFGALLLGYYEDGKLKYAGKVGTGFKENTLSILFKKMQSLQTSKNPFINYNESFRGVNWIKPKLIAKIQFTEWTPDLRLRHPTFLGLKEIKK